MNKFAQIYGLIKKKPAFFLVSLATLMSGIGTAFTSIVVYAELERSSAPAFMFAVAFAAGLLPGLLSSHFSGKWATNKSAVYLLVFAQIAGALMLCVPLAGLMYGQVEILLVAEGIASAVGGFLVPILQVLTRRFFENDELSVISIYESYIFTANFLLGTALGAAIYSIVGSFWFLVVDIFTYLIATALIVASYKIAGTYFVGKSESDRAEEGFRWSQLNPTQKRVFLIMPLLALCCAPSMAVLPKHAEQLGGSAWMLTPVLLVLISRSSGQVFGPLVAGRLDFEKLISSRLAIPVCVFGFLILYAAAFHSSSLLLIGASVFMAHVLSNIVYILSFYGIPRYFDESIIGPVTARNYQLSVLSISLSALAGGWIATHYGGQSLPLLGAGPALALTYALFRIKPEASQEVVQEVTHA